MLTEQDVLNRIAELENHISLSFSKAGRIARPDLAEKQIKLTSELNGLYFCLGKKRPYYACDEYSPARFR